MELFDDGGLKDEGGTVDPVSGNDVPVGSTQEEVRDDIPAQLSEGEFVFPADVVRYIGLEKLMQMRQEAKRGLETMDKMGQMGNSEEAVIPDDIPFELSDLDMEDDPVEMQQGGVAGVSTVPSQIPATSFVQPPPPVTTMPIPPTPAPVPIAPTYTPATQQEVPTFTPEQMKNVSFPSVVQTSKSAPQTVEIINPTTGERRTITYIPGVTQLPEGFILASEYTAPDAQATSVTPVVGQAQTRSRDDDGETPAEKAKRELDAKRMEMAQSFEQEFDFSTAADSPFSSLTGNLKPGQRTNTGYIIGDNGEYLDPLTGDQAFFGLESAKYALNPEDKPDLKLKPGGVNEKFEELTRKRRVTRQATQVAKSIKSTGDKEKDKKAQQDFVRRVSDSLGPTKGSSKKEEKERIKNIQDREEKEQREVEKVREKYDTFQDAFKTGGLASKSKPKPKKMRSGGLASKN